MLCPVLCKQFERLCVRQVPIASTDPFFEIVGITPCCKHMLTIICFQKNRMALAEMLDNMSAGITNVGKHAHFHPAVGYHKTMRIAGVMTFGEGRDS